MSVTRKNHYVPQWYQKGFLANDREQLVYLDLDPDTKALPDGRVVTMNSRRRQGPASCFYEMDLYTTFFGGLFNDEIERFLFGQIDTSGSKAVRAFATDDVAQWHRSFQDFFLYMDAQKLRTPKGLDWIRQHYPDLAQTDQKLSLLKIPTSNLSSRTTRLRSITMLARPMAIIADIQMILRLPGRRRRRYSRSIEITVSF